MSQYEYPADEFDAQPDDAPVPVGVHRAPVPGWRSWLPLLAVIVLAPLLAWGAVSLLGSRAGGSDEAAAPATAAEQVQEATEVPATEEAPEQPAEEPEPTQEPADLTTGVTVHNGTSTNGLAARTSDRLANEGYTAVQVSPGAYAQAEPAVTTVYYSAAEHAATAQALADALGITTVVEDASMAVSNPLVLVLRDDFVE